MGITLFIFYWALRTGTFRPKILLWHHFCNTSISLLSSSICYSWIDLIRRLFNNSCNAEAENAKMRVSKSDLCHDSLILVPFIIPLPSMGIAISPSDFCTIWWRILHWSFSSSFLSVLCLFFLPIESMSVNICLTVLQNLWFELFQCPYPENFHGSVQPFWSYPKYCASLS